MSPPPLAPSCSRGTALEQLVVLGAVLLVAVVAEGLAQTLAERVLGQLDAGMLGYLLGHGGLGSGLEAWILGHSAPA